ncbi:MAG: o-succinylbenzoate synthase [Chitinophagales bacterium]
MVKATYKKYQLQFTSPVLTSRGAMQVKNGYYLYLENDGKKGIGECSFIEGLSKDNLDNYEATLGAVCVALQTQTQLPDLTDYPSLQFGLETALLDLENGGDHVLFKNAFSAGQQMIPINGLVWMGNEAFMLEQIKQKLEGGFRCIKLKVGALAFDEECRLLTYIRNRFSPEQIELRLDANGAFTAADVIRKLETLAQFNIHSIEQPLKPGQISLMKDLCSHPVIPIALDEELIHPSLFEKLQIIEQIKPQYIILKPGLLGGFKICNALIEKAEAEGIGWWATSALESNIGLNAIAQWVAGFKTDMVQGLGTGGLYTNNITSPLYIQQGKLGYNLQLPWQQL